MHDRLWLFLCSPQGSFDIQQNYVCSSNLSLPPPSPSPLLCLPLCGPFPFLLTPSFSCLSKNGHDSPATTCCTLAQLALEHKNQSANKVKLPITPLSAVVIPYNPSLRCRLAVHTAYAVQQCYLSDSLVSANWL